MFGWLFGRKKKRQKKKRRSNVLVIPTVSNREGLWASDIEMRPEDVPNDAKIVRVEKGTKIGKWKCKSTGFYEWKKIKGLSMILLVLLLVGCSKIKYRDIEYTRFGSQKMDDLLIEITEPNGTKISVILEGQKSETELALQAAGFGVRTGGD